MRTLMADYEVPQQIEGQNNENFCPVGWLLHTISVQTCYRSIAEGLLIAFLPLANS